MITLQRAMFKNFRALRDIEITFSVDPQKHLTVIRAENGTGKTSMLYALTWGLFGDRGLPVGVRERARYRLHPIDWDVEADGEIVEISVEIHFSMEDDDGTGNRNFRVVRTAKEEVEPDGFIPHNSEVRAYRESNAGWQEIKDPTAFLEVQVLSPALKDIFFTDSDVALDYVEAGTQDVQRRNVEDAVRKLLGLELLEDAQKHLKASRANVVRRLKKEAADSDLADAISREQECDEQIEIYEAEVRELAGKLAKLLEMSQKAQDERSSVLAAGGGDRERLAKEITDSKRKIGELRKLRTASVSQQRSLLNSSDLYNTMIAPMLIENAKLYDRLRAERKIPNVVPELVRERLEKRVCICGATLEEGSAGYEHLTQQLEDEHRFHESHEILSALADATRGAIELAGEGPQNWFTVSKRAVQEMVRLQTEEDRLSEQLREADARIARIPESNLQVLQDQIRNYATKSSQCSEEIGSAKSNLAGWKSQREALVRDRQRLESRNNSHVLRQSEELAATDLLSVVESTIGRLQTETVCQVSDKMNDIFKRMIVSSPEAASNNEIIQSVELSDDFEIRVNGPDGRIIDAANGLSGAQRRALTISFILALVQISGVHAPNVIDTPLGMTSGALRRAFLEYALENSQQLVLFLTRSEISGVEDILESHAGASWTLSISSHYPQQLANDPGVDRIEVLLCDCGPSQSCSTCERRAV